MQRLLRALQILNLLYGAGVILLGVYLYQQTGGIVSLLLAIGVIIVGPLESLLLRLVRMPGVGPELTTALIDQSTSLAFLITMLVALLASRSG